MLDPTSMLGGAAGHPCGMLFALSADASPAPASATATGSGFSNLLALAGAGTTTPAANAAADGPITAALPALALPEVDCRAPGIPTTEGPPIPPDAHTLERLTEVSTLIQERLPGAAPQPRDLQELPAVPAKLGRTPAPGIQPVTPGDVPAMLAALLDEAAALDSEGEPADALPLAAGEDHAAALPTPDTAAALAQAPPAQGVLRSLPVPMPLAASTGSAAKSTAPVAELEPERPARPSSNRAPRGVAERSEHSLQAAAVPASLSPVTASAATATLPAAAGEVASRPGAAHDAAPIAAPTHWRAASEAFARTMLPTAEPALSFQAQLSAAIDSPGFGPALGLQISTLVAGDISQARLHLNPAELGPIAVQIGLDGQLAQVHLAVEHAATRQALEAALPDLVRALHEAGFTMTGGGVSQQSREQAAAADAGAGSQRSRDGGQRGESGADSASADPGGAMRHRQGLVDIFA